MCSRAGWLARVLALTSRGHLRSHLCPLSVLHPQSAVSPAGRSGRAGPIGGGGGAPVSLPWAETRSKKKNPSIFSTYRSKSVHYLKTSHPASLAR